MSQYQYLKGVSMFLQQTEANSLNQLCDKDFHFHFIGGGVTKSLGIEHKHAIGKQLRDVSSPLENLTENLAKIHLKLLSSKQNSTEYLVLLPCATETKLIFNHVQKIYTDNEVSGIYIKSQISDYFLLHDMLKNLPEGLNHRQANIINLQNTCSANQVKLNDREALILFLIIIGKPDKQIADVVSQATSTPISKSGITQLVIRNLYSKFNVYSRTDLIAKAHADGYLRIIPNLLMTNLGLFKLI